MWVDIERAKEVVERVLISAQNGEGIYERAIIQPELPLISALIKDGESTYTPALLRNGLFLTCSMIFATRTEAFMKRLADPESFSRFSWLYNPEAVTEWDPIQVENACREYMSPGGHQLNAIAGWYQNCTTLVERYSGDILNFLKESNFNAVDVVEQMMDERKSGFVRFGRKLSTLFVIWAQKHNLAHFSDFDKIAIPIDFQIARLMVQLGILEMDSPQYIRNVTSTLHPIFISLISEGDLDPVYLAELLWHLASYGCSNNLHDLCPVRDLCLGVISTAGYRQKGLIDNKHIPF